jgi:hypothetical protein
MSMDFEQKPTPSSEATATASSAKETEQALPPQKAKQVTPGQEAQDAHQQIQDIAIQVGEDPAKLIKHRDIGAVLERMKEGLTISVHISRPRFWSKLTLDDLGLTAGKTLAVSPQAERVFNDYFRLGRRSLLPRSYQDRLNLIETAARQCLARYSFKSHWGAFVPLTMYPKWKEENAELEKEFWALREEIVGHYEAIVEQVVEESRPLAEDAWRRVTLGTALREGDALTQEVVQAIVTRLQEGEGKERFVANYLTAIRAAMPHQWEIEDGFSYEVERGVVPLPSLLAKDMEQADRIYQERAIKDAKTRAELEAIEAQRRAEMQKLTLQQQQEREEHYQRLQAERERQRLQLEMERDVLSDARRQKERLVQQFYTGIVQQINTLVFQVTDNVLSSLEENSGVLKGRVSLQLSNLVKRLEALNFVGDQQIEDQLKRLRDVLPSEAESEKAAKGLARIDTSRIRQVVRAINQETEEILIDLGTQPQHRRRRSQPLSSEQQVRLDTRRRTRAGTILAEVESEEESAPPTQIASRRRHRRTL